VSKQSVVLVKTQLEWENPIGMIYDISSELGISNDVQYYRGEKRRGTLPSRHLTQDEEIQKRLTLNEKPS